MTKSASRLGSPFFVRTNCQVKAIYRNRKRREEGQGILPLQGTKGNSIENFSFCIEYPLCVLALIKKIRKNNLIFIYKN